MTDETSRTRRFEPWPVALCGALLCMILVCVAFYAVAHRYEDPEVVRAGARPGLHEVGVRAP